MLLASRAEVRKGPKESVPTAPIILVLVWLVVGEDRRAHATAWFAPLPPGDVVKEVEGRVSPGLGRRGVRVVRSVFREPIVRIVGIFAGSIV